MRRDLIMLVDDDLEFTKNTKPVLEREGFDVTIAAEGETALRAIQSPSGGHLPDLMVLDVDLNHHIDGREVLRQIRRAGIAIAVILLSQHGDASERGRALNDGADDYLNKPFDTSELIARIRAVLRRMKHSQPAITTNDCLISGELKFDLQASRVWLGNQEKKLTPVIKRLLKCFMTHPGQLLTRRQILQLVYNDEDVYSERIIDPRVHDLREALHDDKTNPRYIESVVGEGYRFIGVVERAP